MIDNRSELNNTKAIISTKYFKEYVKSFNYLICIEWVIYNSISVKKRRIKKVVVKEHQKHAPRIAQESFLLNTSIVWLFTLILV